VAGANALGAGSNDREMLRITPTWLRRVVWQRSRAARYQPGTVFFRDGGQAGFRAVRWTTTGVRLLSDHGATLVSFDQVAELHLPRIDPWAAHFDQLAVLSPTLESRLLQIDTSTGIKATCSQQRFRVQPTGDASDAQTWTYSVQPAWSLDALSLRFREIRQWTWFEADEVPLSRIEPRACVQRSSLGSSWRSWQVDASVQGTPLGSGGQDYGWGFGVHAHNELEFALPASARQFSTRLALDQLAGPAGCVRARIVADTGREPAQYEPADGRFVVRAAAGQARYTGACSESRRPAPSDCRRGRDQSPAPGRSAGHSRHVRLARTTGDARS
jgi:hypothetical protein